MGYDHFALLAIPSDDFPRMEEAVETALTKIRKRVEYDNLFNWSPEYVKKEPLYGFVHHLCAGSFGYSVRDVCTFS